VDCHLDTVAGEVVVDNQDRGLHAEELKKAARRPPRTKNSTDCCTGSGTFARSTRRKPKRVKKPSAVSVRR
jgi:hypothetical protein